MMVNVVLQIVFLRFFMLCSFSCNCKLVRGSVVVYVHSVRHSVVVMIVINFTCKLVLMIMMFTETVITSNVIISSSSFRSHVDVGRVHVHVRVHDNVHDHVNSNVHASNGLHGRYVHLNAHDFHMHVHRHLNMCISIPIVIFVVRME